MQRGSARHARSNGSTPMPCTCHLPTPPSTSWSASSVRCSPRARPRDSPKRAVLRPGGRFLFTVRDRIEDNEFADVVTEAMARLFADDPPRFLARTPQGYHDCARTLAVPAAAGFGDLPEFSTRTEIGRAESARHVAMACCRGTPLPNEIENRDASRLEEAGALAAAALERRCGATDPSGGIRAHVVCVKCRWFAGREEAGGGIACLNVRGWPTRDPGRIPPCSQLAILTADPEAGASSPDQSIRPIKNGFRPALQ